ncbi:MAG: hypothetical protein QM484_13365 [Woeseiaceae bacterium]
MELQQQFNTDRIISRLEFRTLTGISRTTEFRMNRTGNLPAAVVIDGRILGYRESAYLSWLEKNSSL